MLLGMKGGLTLGQILNSEKLKRQKVEKRRKVQKRQKVETTIYFWTFKNPIGHLNQ